MKTIGVQFSEEERERLNAARLAVGCSYEEFAHHATMQAVDEVLADSVRRFVQVAADPAPVLPAALLSALGQR